ncbi:MAG: GNAT family N-acetyltransferase [Lachnospiraceae bacterium]|nr:GNAT family N-acetyltransferase [Lachnospiraceae bacterium]MCI1656845.1 GNAT family N-acetyltransferase [Lachnospiraceae bacterium]MCI2195149.1 GNAT family N-acetyltransferase [Lachnospiraceae bacterium]
MRVIVYEQLPEDARAVRKQVFMEEQGFREEFDETDGFAKGILLYDASKPVGTCRFFYSMDRKAYVIGRVAVLKNYRGQHLGALLLEAAEREICKEKEERIDLHAQVQAAEFYRVQGYVSTGEIGEEEGCPHVWMTKKGVMGK